MNQPTANNSIPFSPPYIPEEAIRAVEEVLRSGWITTGPKVAEFENVLATYCAVEKVVALNSATAALELALRWFGIGPGDEVIVPAYTYAATANVVRHCGATPVFADIDAGDRTTSVQHLERCVSARTKCIVSVDIAGWPVRYDEIMAWAKTLPIAASNAKQAALGRPLYLSDSAHSFGATLDGKKIGCQADFSAFSFHAVKNLSIGEGGALAIGTSLQAVESAAETHAYLRSRSLHGQTKDALAKLLPGGWEYDIVEAGYKCNLTDIAAAIGLVQLARYDNTVLPARKKATLRYHANLKNILHPLPLQDDRRESAYHLCMFDIPDSNDKLRNKIMLDLAEQGIASNVHFKPLPMMTAYQDHDPGQVPNAVSAYKGSISLPLFERITEEQVDRVCEAVRASYLNN